jgi:hypothetical protein
VRDVQPRKYRSSQIAGQHATQPGEVLYVKRLVEPEFSAELIHHRLWRFRRQEDIERVPGNQVDQSEGHDRDPEQDQHSVAKPERNKASHR